MVVLAYQKNNKICYYLVEILQTPIKVLFHNWCLFSPHFSSAFYFYTSVYVVGCGKLFHASLVSSWSEPSNDLKLARPTFYKRSAIDILLGVNIAFSMLKYFHLAKKTFSRLFWTEADSCRKYSCIWRITCCN